MIVMLKDASCPHCDSAQGPVRVGNSFQCYCPQHRVTWWAGCELSDEGAALDCPDEEEIREQERRYNAIGLGEFDYIGPDFDEMERLSCGENDHNESVEG